MLLEELVRYSAQLDLSPSLYAEGPIRYWVNLDRRGRFLPPLVDTADPSNPRSLRGQRRLLPQVVRSSGIRPLLLADKADYTLGFTSDASHTDRARARHRAYVELVERCASETEDPDVASVLAFLKGDPLGQIKPDDDFDPSATISFKVNRRFVIDNPSVQAFWVGVNSDPAAPVMQCLVCGNHRPVLRRLKSKIKGLPGGQPSGTSLISANAAAFESYGLTESLTSPACSNCAEGFTRGINALLSSNRNKLDLVNTVSAFWTGMQHDFDFLSMLESPDRIGVKELLQSVSEGRKTALDDDHFYAVSLSASGARASVRDWLDTTVGQVKGSLACWFRRQGIAAGNHGELLYHGLRALAFSTVRDPRDLPPNTSCLLVRSALTGVPVPRALLALAVRQNRIEQRITRPRLALIKLVLLSHDRDREEDQMVNLDTDNSDPAYLLGRLLAVLEKTEREAIRGINTTITDRLYGTASSAPQAAFPTLLKGARTHLNRLRSYKPAAYFANEGSQMEIITKLHAKDGFPKSLNLEEQGIFALGYYHQKTHDHGRFWEAVERTSGTM